MNSIQSYQVLYYANDLCQEDAADGGSAGAETEAHVVGAGRRRRERRIIDLQR